MAKTELTIIIDERLAAAAKGAAAESGRSESEIVEQALRSHFGLTNVAKRVWSRLDDEGLSDDEAMAVAVSEVKAVRAGKSDND